MPAPQSKPASERLHYWSALAILIVAVLAAYHGSLGGAFVFDDQAAIIDNPTIRNLSDWRQILSPPNNGSPVTGRPLTNLSFAINYATHGVEVRGYHVFNLGVHLCNGVLLFTLLRRLLRSPQASDRVRENAVFLAWAAALLWAVHPLNTSAVTYTSQRAESLGSLFLLLSLYGAVRGSASDAARGWYALSVFACWTGIFFKEICAAIPPLVLICDRLFLRRSWSEVWTPKRAFYLLLFASWIPVVVMMSSTENRGATWGAEAGYSPWQYLLIQCKALLHYLRLIVWPDPLVFDYGRNVPVPAVTSILLQALALLTLLGATVVGICRGKPLAFVGAVFFLVLAQSSSFVPLADPIFEHRVYLASAAVLTGAVLLLHRANRLVFVFSIFLLAGILCSLTIARNRDYQTSLSIWQDTVDKLPSNARAHGNLGQELIERDQLSAAIKHFEKAHELTPQVAVSSHNLANAYQLNGETARAIELYRTTLSINPDNTLALVGLANALMKERKLEEALGVYQDVLKRSPHFVDAQTGAARALLELNRVNEALEYFKRAVDTRPDDAMVHFNYGDALVRARLPAQAVESFQRCLEVRPNYPPALTNLANCLVLLRRPGEAIPLLEEALKTTDSAMLRTNLGYAYLLTKRQLEAAEQFRLALSQDPSYAPARRALDRLQQTPPATRAMP